MCIGLHVKYPLFLTDFNETWIFSTVFREIHRYQTWWKYVEWDPSCSMRRDGRIDMAKLVVVCRSFANAPNYSEKNVSQCLFVHHSSNLDQLGINSAPSRWGSDDLETEPRARSVLRNDFCMVVEILLVERSLVGGRLMYEKILNPVWQSWYASWRTGNRLLRCSGLLILKSGGPIFVSNLWKFFSQIHTVPPRKFSDDDLKWVVTSSYIRCYLFFTFIRPSDAVVLWPNTCTWIMSFNKSTQRCQPMYSIFGGKFHVARL